MARINKAKYWVGVLYQENMREDWQERIGDILQLPYAYCCHTKDIDSKSEHRKNHVHLIVVFPNTTTYNHALSVFDLLSADGKKALNKVEAVIGIRSMYDYLIHDTEACRKVGKHQYDPSERITGNNFDIGSYEQLGTAEKNEMFIELSEVIRQQGFNNYMIFYSYIVDTYDDMNYIEVLKANVKHFNSMLYANRLLYEDKSTQNHEKDHEKTTKRPRKDHEKDHEICCPKCGSIDVIKKGKTLANTQRWACKDCGKKFVV